MKFQCTNIFDRIQILFKAIYIVIVIIVIAPGPSEVLMRPWMWCIYIYAFSRCFYPSDLHCIQVTVSTLYQLLLSLGFEPMILSMLTPCSTSWATGKLYAYIACMHSFKAAFWWFHAITDGITRTSHARSFFRWYEMIQAVCTGAFVLYLKSVCYEHGIFSALIWLAPGAEAMLERASETSPIWCSHKDVLHLNKRNPFQEIKEMEAAVVNGVANPSPAPCINLRIFPLTR